ncbi:MAG: hypothetical protein ACTHK2_18810 [Dokdonella sp.]|uniref:hypothetical protein n=1 Tax=Dokdonella sp. TaxID=2291710 RepID=UPI003F7F2780
MHNRIVQQMALALASVAATPAALACEVAPFSDAWNWGASSAWEESADDCELRAQVTSIDASAAATVSYLRRDPLAPLRLHFTVEAPGLPALNAIQGVSLVRGTPRSAVTEGAAPVFNVVLLGNLSSTAYILGLQGWCAGSSCSVALPSFTSDAFPLDITLDVEIGDETAGLLRLWVNSDPDTTAPSAVLPVPGNAATGGADRVTLGLLATTPAFNQVAAGVPFVFGRIRTSDDQVFWTDFESLAGNVEPNRPPLTTGGGVNSTYAGTTCGGSLLLPQIAYGATSLIGPVAIHRLAWSDTLQNVSLQHAGPFPLRMFLCPAGAGPSGACIAAGQSNGYDIVGAPGGDYQLVIGADRTSECGEYTVTVIGPLDD